MRQNKLLKYLIGIICLCVGMYYTIWCIANKDYTAGWLIIGIVGDVLGLTLIITTSTEKYVAPEPKQQYTVNEQAENIEDGESKTKFTPDEKILINGIDVNKLPYKSKSTAIVLCLFLGIIGMHRFYLGHIKSGIIMLALAVLLGWTIIVPLGLCVYCIIDIVEIINGKLKDSYNRALI